MAEYLIQAGQDINSITEKLQYGDIVLVEAGQYAGIWLKKAGITYKSLERRKAITGQWFYETGANDIKVLGFEVTTGDKGGAFILDRANKNNLIKDNHMHHCGSIGIDIANYGDYNIMEDNLIHDCGYAFHTSSADNIGNIFRRNHCYNHSDGINVSPSAIGTQIIENIIYNCDDDGIHCFDKGAVKIIGNLVHNCKGVALFCSGSGGMVIKQNTIVGLPSAGNLGGTNGYLVYLEGKLFVVKSNIFMVDALDVILKYPWSGSGDFDYNNWYNPQNPMNHLEYNDVLGMHCMLKDPKFVDVANNDYRLQTNSPCIGTGENSVNMGTYILNGGEQPMEQWNVVVNVEATEKGGSITSKVLKKSDGSPLLGVDVTIIDPVGQIQTGITDLNGEHKIENLPKGDYKVAYVHPDYDLNPSEVIISIPAIV